MGNIINIAAMQIAWFACVLGAANRVAWIGTAITVLVAALHLSRAARPAVEIRLIGSALLIGLVLDSALASGGLMSFASDAWVPGLTTHWMLALWVGFATTLTSSLAWLMARPAIAVSFGAVGGPLAYGAGAKLGALTLISPLALPAIAACWAVAMWLFVLLVRRVNADKSAQEALA
jgi:hypothetical protein